MTSQNPTSPLPSPVRNPYDPHDASDDEVEGKHTTASMVAEWTKAPISPPTHRSYGSKEPLKRYLDLMAHEELSNSDGEEEGEEPHCEKCALLFQSPDLARYLSHFDLGPTQMIALARTFANYLSAAQPRKPVAKKAKKE